jgi:hypothetical protein
MGVGSWICSLSSRHSVVRGSLAGLGGGGEDTAPDLEPSSYIVMLLYVVVDEQSKRTEKLVCAICSET